MKRVYSKIRNVLAYLCVGMFIVLFFYSLAHVFFALISGTAADIYETSKTMLYCCYVAALVLLVGALLCMGNDAFMADLVAGSGGCGVGLIILLAFVTMVSGFFAGCLWGPILHFILSVYGALMIFCVSAHFTHKLRKS